MGKIASKCCKTCEANNEIGNTNLEQTRMIMDINNIEDPNFNTGGENLFNSKAKTKLKEEMNSFIEINKCILILTHS